MPLNYQLVCMKKNRLFVQLVTIVHQEALFKFHVPRVLSEIILKVWTLQIAVSAQLVLTVQLRVWIHQLPAQRAVSVLKVPKPTSSAPPVLTTLILEPQTLVTVLLVLLVGIVHIWVRPRSMMLITYVMLDISAVLVPQDLNLLMVSQVTNALRVDTAPQVPPRKCPALPVNSML